MFVFNKTPEVKGFLMNIKEIEDVEFCSEAYQNKHPVFAE
jgi:hypothetical protein